MSEARYITILAINPDSKRDLTDTSFVITESDNIVVVIQMTFKTSTLPRNMTIATDGQYWTEITRNGLFLISQQTSLNRHVGLTEGDKRLIGDAIIGLI